MDWIPVCDRLDHWLHEQGVPDDLRMKAMADIASTLIQAGNRAKIRAAEDQALSLATRGMMEVTERQNCHRSTAYRRLGRAVARIRLGATNPA